MPLLFSFELDGAAHEPEQIGSLIERLGWERVDARTYRYPRLSVEHGERPLEDWMNHVIPALMLFRSYVLTRRLTVRSYTLEVCSSSGYRRDAEIGSPPLKAEHIGLYEPSRWLHSKHAASDEERHSEEWLVLREWLDSANFPQGL